jgi:hypothetical protein
MIVDLRALMAVCSLSLPVLRGQSSWSASSSRTLAFTTLQRAQRLTLKQHQQSYANDLVDLDSPPPPTWTELQDIISSGQLEKLKRSLACQRDYDRHKVEIQKEWVSLYDYILYDKFGLERTKDSSGRYCVVPSKQIQISLKENTFPYHVGENVDHWVLYVSFKVVRKLLLHNSIISNIYLSVLRIDGSWVETVPLTIFLMRNNSCLLNWKMFKTFCIGSILLRCSLYQRLIILIY